MLCGCFCVLLGCYCHPGSPAAGGTLCKSCSVIPNRGGSVEHLRWADDLHNHRRGMRYFLRACPGERVKVWLVSFGRSCYSLPPVPPRRQPVDVKRVPGTTAPRSLALFPGGFIFVPLRVRHHRGGCAGWTLVSRAPRRRDVRLEGQSKKLQLHEEIPPPSPIEAWRMSSRSLVTHLHRRPTRRHPQVLGLVVFPHRRVKKSLFRAFQVTRKWLHVRPRL